MKGIPTIVIVDDYLLFDKNTSRLVFDNIASDGALWGPLLEKVWAKVNGNYENIIGGDPLEALSILLGTPGDEYSLN